MAAQYPQDYGWIQRDRSVIRVGDMTDSHIANCVRMLRRQEERLWDQSLAGFSYGGNPDGMGAYYAEQAGNESANRALEKQALIEMFTAELRRRYPNERIHIRPDGERLPRRSF